MLRTSHTCIIASLASAVLLTGIARADVVFPDDVIVQGSLCVGLDCVNNENFGFDTIRLKENNTRIKFDDTSTGAGFPANDWQLTANDSANGGSSKFSIEDITGSRVPFTVIAGAPTNSMFVANTGKVGLRTATPGLDLQITTSDTPAHRLEQTNAGGFTAQTWDIGGNEANFFVRDLTGGSRLSFRIRPGAPTSSLDIAGSGNVGIGTASPGSKLHVFGTSTADTFTALGPSASGTGADGLNLGYGGTSFAVGTSFLNAHSAGANGTFLFLTDGTTRATVNSTGIGIGTAPAAQLHTTSSVRFAGLPNCATGIVSSANGTLSCLSSSRQFKNVAGDLPSNVALANVMALRPQTGSYKETPDVQEHWFIAEEVAAIDPALVGLNDGKPHVVKTQNVVADLVAVVQQQQRQIDELKRLLLAKQ